MSLHPRLARLFGEWDLLGVRWALLRSRGDLSTPEGDVDVLVEPSHLPQVLRAARDAGFAELPGPHRGTHLLIFDRPSAWWLWLHVVTDLGFGPWHAIGAGLGAGCLGRRETGPVARLAPGDEFWVTLMHDLIDHREVRANHRCQLARLATEAPCGGELVTALAALLPADFGPAQLRAAAAAGRWSAVEAVVPAVGGAARTVGRPSLLARGHRRVTRLLGRLRQFPRTRGVSVALLGPDGAGKSTLAEGLHSSFVLPTRGIYMGLTGGWLRHADRLRVPGVVGLLRLGIIWGRYLRAQYHVARGRLVVFDRYIFDADVPPPFPLSAAGRLARWVEGRACPAPDIAVVLDAPGWVMHERKREYDAATLEHWRARFLTLRRRVRGLEIVDATAGAEVVRAEVLERIWRRYAERWRRS
jgi:thymidylate kinase